MVPVCEILQHFRAFQNISAHFTHRISACPVQMYVPVVVQKIWWHHVRARQKVLHSDTRFRHVADFLLCGDFEHDTDGPNIAISDGFRRYCNVRWNDHTPCSTTSYNCRMTNLISSGAHFRHFRTFQRISRNFRMPGTNVCSRGCAKNRMTSCESSSKSLIQRYAFSSCSRFPALRWLWIWHWRTQNCDFGRFQTIL